MGRGAGARTAAAGSGDPGGASPRCAGVCSVNTMGTVTIAAKADQDPGPTAPAGPPAAPGTPEPPRLLEPGTRVDVRDRFQGRWTHGFVVAEATPESYRLRRLSDNSVLPGVFAHDSVRRERGPRGTWWY